MANSTLLKAEKFYNLLEDICEDVAEAFAVLATVNVLLNLKAQEPVDLNDTKTD